MVERRARQQPFVSLAVLAILLQVATIYALNAMHKNGVTWRRGQAVHWVLWQSRAATPADWVAHHEPAWFSPLLTYGTLLIESLMPDFEVAMRGPLPYPMPVADLLYAMHYDGEQVYRGELENYLRRWQELTGRPASDRIVRYEGWYVSHNTPPPGSTQHSNFQKKLIFSGQ